MNRYESAYRDYTIPRAGDESSLYPQRPERTAKVGGGGIRIAGSRMTESSDGELHDSFEQRIRTPSGQQQHHFSRAGGGFSSTDEDGSFQPPIHQSKSRLISSRELSDRSGGERSNPEFVVANEAMQTAYQR